MLSCKSSRTDRDPGDDDDEPQQKSAVIADSDDLMTDILLRLPVKSLLRFKSVSKRWLSLISNPRFSRRGNSVSGLILTKYFSPEIDFVSLNGNEIGIPFRSFSFTDDARGMRLVQSCNGLLCCRSHRAGERRRNYYIYNPATNQHTTLPRPPDTIVFGINLAFDPLKSPHYKVVCVRLSDESAERYQIEIYSSETGSWRSSGDPFPDLNDLDFDAGVYWNGAIHWVDNWGTSRYFDIEREILLTMPMPPIPEAWDERGIRYFGESRGHLHLIEIYDPPATQFDVLEMENDYSKWVVKYRVDLDALITAYPEMVRKYRNHFDFNRNAFSVLCLVRGEKEEDSSSLVLHIPNKVISYNLQDKTFKKLLPLQPCLLGIEDSFGRFVAHQYIETLSSV